MSSTVYQTTAKPRGRNADNVGYESSGRASSSTSQRLSKTTSRTLDEATSSKPPQSPAIFWHRNKAIDHSDLHDAPPSSTGPDYSASHDARRTEQTTFGSKTGTGTISVPGAFPTGESGPDQYRVTMAPPSSSVARVLSQNRPQGRRSPSSHRTRSLTQSSIARMQPTVTDASEDDMSGVGITAKSSATSLEIQSAQGSDAGAIITEKLVAKPPPPPPSHDPPPATPVNDTSRRRSSPSQNMMQSPPSHRSTDLPSSAFPQHVYPPPPPGYSVSPRQYPVDSRRNSRSSALPPNASPPQSPTMVYPSVFGQSVHAPNPYGYLPQSVHSQPTMNGYYAQEPSVASPPFTSTVSDAITAQPDNDIDESQKDWAKLTSVLPELNRLLARYQDQNGQTAARESFSQSLDFQRTQEMARLRIELDANKVEYEKVISSLITESYANKRELEERNMQIAKLEANMDEMKAEREEYDSTKSKYGEMFSKHELLQRDHRSLSANHQDMTAELQTLKAAHEKLQRKHDDAVNDLKHYKIECTNWKSKHQEAATASDHARLAKEDFVSTRMRLETGMEDQRRRYHAKEEKYLAEIRALRKEYEAMVEQKERERESTSLEHKAIFGAVQLELTGLSEKYIRQKKELEVARGQISNLEKKVESKARDKEEQAVRHRQQLESRTKEMEEQSACHRQQLESQMKLLNSQRHKELDALKLEHQSRIASLEKEHDSKTIRLIEEHNSELRHLQADLKMQKDAFEQYTRDTERARARQGEIATAMASWRRRQEEWQVEQDKLHKLMEGLNEP